MTNMTFLLDNALASPAKNKKDNADPQGVLMLAILGRFKTSSLNCAAHIKVNHQSFGPV